MTAQLASTAMALRTRALIVAVGLLVVLAALAGWRALSSGPTLVVGTVSLVSANGTKFCVIPESGDQWCGRLATSGAENVAVGTRVTVVVNSIEADPRSLTIGTVVPGEFTVR